MSVRDQRDANRAYYWRNRERELARVRTRQDATRDLLRRLRERPCAECQGSFAPYQMDFDHDGLLAKSFRLTSGRAMLASRSRLMAEVEKCVVVCANCHRIRTRDRAQPKGDRVEGGSRYLDRRRESWRHQARLLDAIKDVPCADCHGSFPPCAMDFDHRVGEVKRIAVSRMIGRAGTATIMAEVAKCDIV